MDYQLTKQDARDDFLELARDASQGFCPPEVATIQVLGRAAGGIRAGKELETFQQTIEVLKESTPNDL